MNTATIRLTFAGEAPDLQPDDDLVPPDTLELYSEGELSAVNP